jgi:hypothetical protein
MKQLYPIILFLTLIFPTHSYSQAIFNDSLSMGSNYEKAAFRIWVNDSTQFIEGVIVLVPGSNGDARANILDPAWQKLATKHNLAIMGCNFIDKRHENMMIEKYAYAPNGSGQALLNALSNFSIQSNHPELEYAPLALWGMSAGGQFNYEFVCWKPERVITFVVNKGGVYYTSLSPAKSWEVPGIFFTGDLDTPYRSNIIKGIFTINRRFGAKWALIEEPNMKHRIGSSQQFSIEYFDAIIPIRLKEKNILSSLLDKGIIGSVKSKKIIKDGQDINDVTNWFPNKSLAEKWLSLVKNGK